MGSGASFIGSLLGQVGTGIKERKERGREREGQQTQLTFQYLSNILKDPNLRPEARAELEGVFSNLITEMGKKDKDRKAGLEAGRSTIGSILGGANQPNVLDTSTQTSRNQNAEYVLDQSVGPKGSGEVKPALAKRSPYYSPEERSQQQARAAGMQAGEEAKARLPYLKEMEDVKAGNQLKKQEENNEARLAIETMKAGVRRDIVDKKRLEITNSLAVSRGHTTTTPDGRILPAPTMQDIADSGTMIISELEGKTKEREARIAHLDATEKRWKEQDDLKEREFVYQQGKDNLNRANNDYQHEIKRLQGERDEWLKNVRMQESKRTEAIGKGNQAEAAEAERQVDYYFDKANEVQKRLDSLYGNKPPLQVAPAVPVVPIQQSSQPAQKKPLKKAQYTQPTFSGKSFPASKISEAASRAGMDEASFRKTLQDKGLSIDESK